MSTRLPEMLDLLRDGGCDIVVGSRHVEGGDASGLSGAWRHRLSEGGIRIAQRLLPAKLGDPMSGFFMLPRALFERLAPRLTGQGFKILLDLLLEIVFAEGALTPEKLAIVRRLCASLGVHEQELAALAAMRGYGFGHTGGGYRQSQQPPGAPPGKDPYAVLGLPREASDREVKTAYRRLIGQHHPDKLGDVPEELKRRAEDRAREINIAYEKIRAERGFT